MHRISPQVSGPFLLQKGCYFGHSDETLFRILWDTSCWCLLFVCHMLRVILAPFLLCFVYFQLTDFLHHLLLRVLQQLQHFNEDVSIVNGDSWLWLGFNPHFVDTFRLVGLLLVRCFWPGLCLQRHDALVSCCHGFWGHLFMKAFVPICFPTPQQSRKFKCDRPFCDFGVGLSSAILKT